MEKVGSNLDLGTLFHNGRKRRGCFWHGTIVIQNIYNVYNVYTFYSTHSSSYLSLSFSLYTHTYIHIYLEYRIHG